MSVALSVFVPGDRPALCERCPRERRGCGARDDEGDERPPCCECHPTPSDSTFRSRPGWAVSPLLTLGLRGLDRYRVFAVSADYAAPVELRLATAGESHGPALVAILTGLPAGLVLERGAIDADLRRRQEGYGRSPRQQIEQDAVEVLAGLRHGRTLGTPLALVVRNRDHANWEWGMIPWPPEGEAAGKGSKPVTLPAPGPRRLAGALKYGLDDARDALERASARHTAVHVAAGAVAKALLR